MYNTMDKHERAIAVSLIQHYRRQCKKRISAHELREYQKKIRALRYQFNL